MVEPFLSLDMVVLGVPGIISLGGLGFVLFLFLLMGKMEKGNKRMIEISSAIYEGARAFLFREYKILLIFILLVTALLVNFFNIFIAIAYILGASCSILAGFAGMMAATKSNVLTAAAARKNLSASFRTAFLGGSVLGLAVVGLGLGGVVMTICAFILFLSLENAIQLMAGFGFGASSVALFARVGGGIYTKGADVGADLVGKVEKGIPEDDPRNPAVIADQVGDNVGDIAGMGADLFESYVNSIIAAAAIGIFAIGVAGVTLPLMIACAGILASIIGGVLVKSKDVAGFQQQTEQARAALNRGTLASSLLVLIATFSLVIWMELKLGIFYSVLAGLIAGIIIGRLVEYYTSDKRAPVRSIAESAKTGPAVNIITGLSVGMQSTMAPILVICVAILAAYSFAGLYGIAIAAVGMLSVLGMILSVDGYGPITDNAAGIAELAELGPETRSRAEALDSVGNTTAAIGKGFAISSAALTALALFAAYSSAAGLNMINIMNPPVIVGLFIGAALPFLFSALTMSAVGKTAFKMVHEVRRQFREIAGLMRGRARPDYARCVDISTKEALKLMVIPGLIVILTPPIVGFSLGPEAVGGLLAGAISTGFLLAIMMANAGGAWDNAKKYIEAGNLGGKGSAAHKAAVVGDTVGDPCKDTAGPSLNILIKLMSIVALIFAPLFI